jgi:hypothetical protein
MAYKNSWGNKAGPVKTLCKGKDQSNWIGNVSPHEDAFNGLVDSPDAPLQFRRIGLVDSIMYVVHEG